MRYDLHVFDRVKSTNLMVKEAIGWDEPEGWVVHAYCQEEGYGRQGSTWNSPLGGLYLSVLLRPENPVGEIQTLPLAVAVAVRRACQVMGAAPVIKWPNDLIYGVDEKGRFKKLCGITVEQYNGAICLGVGLNVVNFSRSSALANADDVNAAAYVYPGECATDGRAQVNQARDLVLNAISDVYAEWCRNGFDPIVSVYRTASFLDGKQVEVLNANGEVRVMGRAKGIAGDGALMLDTAEGEALVYSGSVRLCPHGERMDFPAR